MQTLKHIEKNLLLTHQTRQMLIAKNGMTVIVAKSIQIQPYLDKAYFKYFR